MSLKYYTVLFLFVILSSSIKAQNIPEGYRYLGDLDISQSDYYPTELKYFKEANVIAINSGARKSLTEVFNIDSWEKVGSFIAKKWLYSWTSFTDSQNPNILYFGGGRKFHRYNLKTKTYDMISSKKISNVPEDLYSNLALASTSYHGDIITYMIPEYYIITCNESIAKIYLWEGRIN